MLRHRMLTAAVGIPILLALIYLGSWPLGLAVLILSTVGLREFYRLTTRDAIRSNRVTGYVAGALIIAATVIEGTSFPHEPRRSLAALNDFVVIVLVATVFALLVRQVLEKSPHPIAARSAGVAILGMAYVPLLFSFLLRLRYFWTGSVWLPALALSPPAGACWLTLVVATCWASDLAAYAIGSKLGRRRWRILQHVSARKTIEGAVGGLLAAVAVAALLGPSFGLAAGPASALGAIIAVTGQLGDLSESVMKRDAKRDTSGAVLPGHGGVLDRFDSLLFSAPFAYYYLSHVVGR